MSLKIAFSVESGQDIDDIIEYFALDNPEAAQAVAGRIEKSLRLLAERPHMGHPAPETGQEGMRRMSVPPYIVFYRIGDSELQIARVLHSSRFLADESLFKS